MFANLVFYGMVSALSLFFQSIERFTLWQTGLAFLPMMLMLMAMNIIAGRLVSRAGARMLATVGIRGSACGYLLIIPALASLASPLACLLARLPTRWSRCGSLSESPEKSSTTSGSLAGQFTISRPCPHGTSTLIMGSTRVATLCSMFKGIKAGSFYRRRCGKAISICARDLR
ncbi:MAG: hypothetical protein ACFWTR_26980 [Pseudomonas shahriarae]|jgi:hypothetical protein